MCQSGHVLFFIIFEVQVILEKKKMAPSRELRALERWYDMLVTRRVILDNISEHETENTDNLYTFTTPCFMEKNNLPISPCLKEQLPTCITFNTRWIFVSPSHQLNLAESFDIFLSVGEILLLIHHPNR